MIAKKSPRLRTSKSSFRTLANYIARNGDCETTRVTNCGFESPALAIVEIEAVQQLNTRAKSDKSYHLIVSLREGEQLEPDALHSIEDSVCEAIGLGEHQRISAIHNDTNNQHIHIAINKIHPVTLNIIDPYNDFYSLDEVCRELELKHGLQIDNRIEDTRSLENDAAKPIPSKVAAIESHSALKSFRTWATVEARPELESVMANSSNWEALHKGLAELGVTIKPHGNGLVLGAGKAWMKASDFDRGWSKNKLEKAFGAYQISEHDVSEKNRNTGYQKRPMSKNTALYEQYLAERHQTKVARLEREKVLVDELKARNATISQKWKASGAQIRSSRLPGKRKFQLYQSTAAYNSKELKRSRETFSLALKQVKKKTALISYQEFLINRASAGDGAALAALRYRKQKREGAGNCLTGAPTNTIHTRLKPIVTKRGVSIYKFEDGSVAKDYGDRIDVNLKSQQFAPEILALAKKNFGASLKVEGEDSFLRKITNAASEVDVSFADQRMETKRQLVKEFGIHSKPTPPNLADVLSWIDQRNATAQKVKDLKPHTLFSEKHAGSLQFAGIRKVENSFMATFDSKDERIVLPISDRQAQRYKGLALGAEIKLSKSGALVKKRTYGIVPHLGKEPASKDRGKENEKDLGYER